MYVFYKKKIRVSEGLNCDFPNQDHYVGPAHAPLLRAFFPDHTESSGPAEVVGLGWRQHLGFLA